MKIDSIYKNYHELHEYMLPYAKLNFEKAKDYILSEDWLYKNTFEKMNIL